MIDKNQFSSTIVYDLGSVNPVQRAASVKNSSCLSNWPLGETYLPTIQLTAVVKWSGGHGYEVDRGPDYDEQARNAWRKAAPEGLAGPRVTKGVSSGIPSTVGPPCSGQVDP